MKRGIIVTAKGIIIVASTSINTVFRSGQSTLEKPYAANEQDMIDPTTENPQIITVFFRYVKNGIKFIALP